MRKVFAVAMMTAMVGAVGFSQSAEAGVTYDYVFRTTDINGAPVDGGSVSGNGLTFTFSSLAAANGTCPACGSGGAVADIFLRTTDPLVFASTSVMWDNSAGLGIVRAATQEWAGQGVTFNAMNNPIRSFAPFAGLDCAGAGTSELNTCQSFDGSLLPPNAPPSLPAGTYNIGTIVWDTSTVDAEGSYAVMTFILSGIDATGAVIGGNIVDITGTEEDAMGFINIVPEPATAGLLGLGLAGLVLAGRRRRA